MKINNVIIRALVTEKSTNLVSLNQYSFEVNANSSKNAISKAVSDLFKVDVLDVRTMVNPGRAKRILKSKKYTRIPKWKKAIVSIRSGQSIGIFETKEK